AGGQVNAVFAASRREPADSVGEQEISRRPRLHFGSSPPRIGSPGSKPARRQVRRSQMFEASELASQGTVPGQEHGASGRLEQHLVFLRDLRRLTQKYATGLVQQTAVVAGAQ